MNGWAIRAYTRGKAGGQLAGVVLGTETVAQMQALAKELNFAETAFVHKKTDNIFSVAYFTPAGQIAISRYASLAVLGFIKEHFSLPEGTYFLKGYEHTQEAYIQKEKLVLSQKLPVCGEMISREEIALTLGIATTSLSTTALQPQVVSTGYRDIIVPVLDRKTLLSIAPHFPKISALCEKYSAASVHLFALDPIQPKATAHTRNFAPKINNDEAAATATANAALAGYLFHNKAMRQNEMVFEQGDVLQSPSNIYVRLVVSGDTLAKVEYWGNVVLEKPFQ